jgi:hypothetical protein
LLRRKDLCPTPSECPEVLIEDPLAGPSVLPCEHCPEVALSNYLASPSGQLILAVIDLDFALQAGITVTLPEIPYPMFLLLRQLADERDKYEAEEIRKQRKR